MAPHRFQPGQSGNPNGRPKTNAEVRDLARQYTTEAIDTLASIMRRKNAKASDRISAAKELLERGWGKAPQHHHLSDADGNSVTLIYAEEAKRKLTDLVASGDRPSVDRQSHH